MSDSGDMIDTYIDPDGVPFHQTFQVPKMEVLTYISSMDTAYVRENPPPK